MLSTSPDTEHKRIPRYGVLPDNDLHVMQWCWKTYNLHPIPVAMAIGIIDNYADELAGCAYFTNWNLCDIELNLYGEGAFTKGIFRYLALIACTQFNVIRVTIKTQRKHKRLRRTAEKFGFEYEGIERDLYGKGKDAIRMVMFRPALERLAGKHLKDAMH